MMQMQPACYMKQLLIGLQKLNSWLLAACNLTFTHYHNLMQYVMPLELPVD
jgi:hypothetical protein